MCLKSAKPVVYPVQDETIVLVDGHAVFLHVGVSEKRPGIWFTDGVCKTTGIISIPDPQDPTQAIVDHVRSSRANHDKKSA